MADSGRLAGQIVVITGTAHGIGRATAELFAAEGTTLVAVDVDASANEALVGELWPLDDADDDHWQRMIDIKLRSAFVLIRALLPALRRFGVCLGDQQRAVDGE